MALGWVTFGRVAAVGGCFGGAGRLRSARAVQKAFTASVTAALMSASPGALGGLRGLAHLRRIFSNLGVIDLPDQIAVARAQDAFKPDGSLTDARQQVSVEALGKTLASLLVKLNA